jgi:pyruvate/2-oxoglutarate dehydrogenase complex dihydrolipoamide acyltransferase (E2) component
LTAELTQLQKSATKRRVDDMQGGGFTITNLAHRGTNFSRLSTRRSRDPWHGTRMPPRTVDSDKVDRAMLPLFAAYDHRAIDAC